eukprot:TRINITY_DN2286_c0_g2_i1.p1 TRINITY_DN2286_c0_g2~~TRINITY_DN2286_c0_g2_i1.p1  ORF type:complete len:696 (-),score=129.69 TRINITY_DN2286_c0_g2_i1:87-1940(-)
MPVALEHVSIFQDCDETTLKNLAGYLKPLDFKAGAFIVHHGDLAKDMFFISQGSVEIINNNNEVVAIMKDGEFFGEMGLVFSIPRTASVRAATDVICHSLSKEDFNNARLQTPSIETRVQEIAKFRFARFREELARLAHNQSGEFTPEQARVFREVFSFWDRDNDDKLTKEETGEMMEIISGKKFPPEEIDKIIRMIDHDKDGVVSYDDFRQKIWNLRWFIEPQQGTTVTSLAPAQSMEETPFWGLHWSETGCGNGAQFFLSKALQWLENGDRIKQQGIYRLSGESNVLEVYRHTLLAVPKSIIQILATSDLEVHNITGLIKLYFREMPEPLIPFDLYSECIAVMRIEAKKDQKAAIIDVVNHLPDSNRRVLKILTRHLNKVCSFSSKNSMPVKNVAIVFGPTLLRPQVETQDTLIGHSELVSGFIGKLISKHGTLLSDDNLKGFKPRITITPHLPPKQTLPTVSVGKKAKNEDKSSSGTSKSDDKDAAMRASTKKQAKKNANRKSVMVHRDKRTSTPPLTPTAISSTPNASISLTCDINEKIEIINLLDHIQQESRARDYASALLAYKDALLSLKFSCKCTKCGKISVDAEANYCSACGGAVKTQLEEQVGSDNDS